MPQFVCWRLGCVGAGKAVVVVVVGGGQVRGKGWNSCEPLPGRQNTFVEIDHEIFSMVTLSLMLSQEGQLSVPGERMSTILVNHLEAKPAQ